MLNEYVQYGLLTALAITLLVIAIIDLRSGKIDNRLNAGIVIGAPLWWIASGLPLWPGVALQLGVALAAFAVCAGLFKLRQMGGGDVKLLTALALWIDPSWFFSFLLMMALVGGLLTIIFGSWHLIRRKKGRPLVIYGPAITVAGLWVLGVHHFPAVAASAAAAGTM